MKLQITNREIAYAINNVWDSLPIKFKYRLYEVYKENSGHDFVQEVEVDEIIFKTIMYDVSSIPQGIAKDINPALHLKLLTQIATVATPVFAQLSKFQTELEALTDEAEIEAKKLEIAEYTELHKETIGIKTAATAILDRNTKKLEAMIASGIEKLMGEK